MNKQPFYCSVTINFTATEEITESKLSNALQSIKWLPSVLDHTVEVESFVCEAGDPADLM